MSGNPSNFSLYKRGSHYHILYYLHGRRRWKSAGATAKRDALKALSRFQELLNKTPTPVSLKEFSERFFAFAESSYSPRTVETYNRALPRFLKLIGDQLLVEITAEHFDRYKSERLRRVSPVTANIELRALRAAFNTAKRWRLIERHPFEDVSLATVPQQAPSFVSPQDFQRLLDSIREKWFRDCMSSECFGQNLT
ncbi:MAG: phage integrase N-terminal SAM-like domain-containing protein [Bacteroidota bacterium]